MVGEEFGIGDISLQGEGEEGEGEEGEVGFPLGLGG